MRRYLSSIVVLMVIVVFAAISFAAFRSAWNQYPSAWWWTSGFSTMAGVAVGFATVVAFSRRGRARMPWIGFAVFGWLHININYRATSLPDKLAQWFIEVFCDISHAPGQSMDLFDLADAFLTIVYAVVGAVIGKVVAARDEEERIIVDKRDPAP